ncbi:MAG TPA: glucuronate isomerase, partial [Pirellulaceae bacterium]|nr:glucuronate isomerase [Pirellulaceae bacterium]
WTLAEMCEAFKLPFDLMIGVNRGVYEAGVYQGRDLYDSRVSLIQYKELFNAFPRVTFPISVLASVTNQELTSYAWIFPNVVTNGHWWYSNTPAFIEHDLAARLEAVPRTKQIGYYSDMYKLEFALPKFAMFKRILAKVLAERFVIDRSWSEEQAVALGTQVLRGNVESIFRWGENLRQELPDEGTLEPLSPSTPLGPIPAAVAVAAQSISNPIPGESEIVDRLPVPPATVFVRPVPEQLPGEELRVEGAASSDPTGEPGNQPPELEVIEDAAEDESVRKTLPLDHPQWDFLREKK